MANLIRRDNGNRPLSRDPFSLARDLLAWDFFEPVRTTGGFAPRFEVKDTPDSFVFKADLPGVKDSELDISLHDGVLSVSGARIAEEKKEGESYYLYERKYGSFSRSFSLPDIADPDRVEADLKDGVLTIKVGKRAEAKPRKIGLRKG
jgi:HSP20 family protein